MKAEQNHRLRLLKDESPVTDYSGCFGIGEGMMGLQMLRTPPDNCIRAFHRGRPGCFGYSGGKVLIRHCWDLIPEEIVLKPVMFLKVQNDLCVTER